MSVKEYKTRGIVLKKTNFSEVDRILTVLTKDKGKIGILAKGVRKPVSKFGAKVDFFNELDLLLVAGKNLDILKGAEVRESFEGIKGDIVKTSLAFYFCEITNHLLPEHQKSIDIFELLEKSLYFLTENNDFRLLPYFFEIKLLTFLGYKPELNHCVFCHRKLEKQGNYFSNRLGGVLGGICRKQDFFSKPISVNLIKLLRILEKINLPDIKKIKVSLEILKEAEVILEHYLIYLMGGEPKSKKILKKLS